MSEETKIELVDVAEDVDLEPITIGEVAEVTGASPSDGGGDHEYVVWGT